MTAQGNAGALGDRWNRDGFPEERLPGGDVTDGIVRVGDTVRRPQSPVSQSVHELLIGLERAGFHGAPRFLGIDPLDREVLSFVEGEVASRPWPEWVGEDERAASVARLVRSYDDAATALGVFDWRGANSPPLPPTAPPPNSPEPQFIAHLDITPENVVFREERAFALIDFDLARPASRVDEVVNLLLWWGGWMPEDDREPAMRGLDVPARTKLLLDEYGLSPSERGLLFDVALRTSERAWYSMKHRSHNLGGGWRRMWDDGVGDRILRRQAWLRLHSTTLRAAATS